MSTTLLPQQDMAPALARDARFAGLADRLRGIEHSQVGGTAEDRQRQSAELRQAARDFEAVFLKMMFEEMRPGKEDGEGGFFGNGVGSDIYEDMFFSELSKLMSETGQLGLARIIEEQVAEQTGIDLGEDREDYIPPATLGRALPQPIRSVVQNVYSSVSKFLMPLAGRISSEFGLREDPFDGETRRHKGIDIAAPAGSAVKATADGRVKFSGDLPGYGNTVIIEHAGGYETRYAHNANNKVEKGEPVKAGQVIATVGETGRATGPHLHFEVRRDGEAVDPLGMIP